MHSNFSIKNHFKEENDFFLSYVNDKLKEIENQLNLLDVEEQNVQFNHLDQFAILNTKITLLNTRKEFEHMKEHYYLALNYGKNRGNSSYLSKKNKKSEKEFFSDEQKYNIGSNNNMQLFQNKMKNVENIHMNVEGMDFQKPLLNSILNLIHVAKSIKHLRNQDEFLNYLYNNNMKLEEINEITTFYKSCFSKSANKNFYTNEAKLLFCNNMLEIYCNENHPLHNHFRGMKQKIENIAKSSIFLSKNPNEFFKPIGNLINNQNMNKNDQHNLSGSQSDDTRRVIKKNFHRNKANLESYDGDSEKSIHKSEREEVKEENEEEFIENKAKSDGENDRSIEVEQFFNKPKFKSINNKNKFNKFKKSRKLKKMFDDSGDHATGSASDKNYEDTKTKLFSWGIRGLQKINNRPPKGFDTDKDMKL